MDTSQQAWVLLSWIFYCIFLYEISLTVTKHRQQLTLLENGGFTQAHENN